MPRITTAPYYKKILPKIYIMLYCSTGDTMTTKNIDKQDSQEEENKKEVDFDEFDINEFLENIKHILK